MPHDGEAGESRRINVSRHAPLRTLSAFIRREVVTLVRCGALGPVAVGRSAAVAAFQAHFAYAGLPGWLPSAAPVCVPGAPVAPVRDAAPER